LRPSIISLVLVRAPVPTRYYSDEFLKVGTLWEILEMNIRAVFRLENPSNPMNPSPIYTRTIIPQSP
jgi:hypothetical protein